MACEVMVRLTTLNLIMSTVSQKRWFPKEMVVKNGLHCEKAEGDELMVTYTRLSSMSKE